MKMADFESLNLTISAESSAASGSITTLTKSLKALQTSLAALDVSRITQSLQSVTNLTNSLSNAMSNFKMNRKFADGITQGLSSIAAAVDSISEESISKIERLGNALGKLSNMPKIDIEVPMSDSTSGSGSMSRRSGNSTSAFMNTYADSLKNSLGTSLRLAGRGASEAMHGLSSALRELYKGFGLGHIGSSQFLSSLARIAKYRFLRSIIKSITSGIKTGLQNIAHYSAEANAALSQLSTGSLYLKNSLGAALYPAISSLIGVFSSLVGVVVRALNVLNMLFSLLGGKGTYIRATKQTKDFTKATGAAGGAAKALKQELMGFDEINALSPDGGGGGGGGGGSSLDYGGMFETVPIEGWMKDMLAKMDFSPLGQRIADKINAALKKIKWQDIQTGAKNIGHAIATAINGFFLGEEGIKGKDGINANLVASAIAGAINTAAGLIATFWEDTEWEKIGAKIKWTLVQALNKIDTNMLGRAITGKLRAMIRFAKGWLTGDGKGFFATLGTKIGQTLNSALSTLPASDLAKAITGLIGDAADGVQNFLTSADFDLAADKVNQFIGTAISTMPFGSIGDAIVTVINKAAKFFKLKATQDNITAIAGKVAKFLHDCIVGIEWDEVGKALGGIVNAIAKGVTDALKGAGEEGKSPIRDAIEGFLSAIDIKAVFNVTEALINSDVGKVLTMAALVGSIASLIPAPIKSYGKALIVFGLDAGFRLTASVSDTIEAAQSGDSEKLKKSIGRLIAEAIGGAVGAYLGFGLFGFKGMVIGLDIGVRIGSAVIEIADGVKNTLSEITTGIDETLNPDNSDLSPKILSAVAAATAESSENISNAFTRIGLSMALGYDNADLFKTKIQELFGLKVGESGFLEVSDEVGGLTASLTELLGLNIDNSMVISAIDNLIPGFSDRLLAGAVSVDELKNALSMLGTGLSEALDNGTWYEYMEQLGLTEAVAKKAYETTSDAASEMGKASDATGTNAQKIQGVAGKISDGASAIQSASETLSSNTSDMTDSTEKLKNIADDMPDVIMIDGSSMDGVKKSATEASNAVGGLTSFIVMIQKKLNEFTGSFQPLADSASNANETAGTLKETISEIPVRKVTAFTMIGADTARKQVQKIKDALSGISSKTISIKVNAGLTAGAKSFLNELKSASDTATRATINNLLKFSQFANGGFPKSGELFMANENGRQELVGRIGSKPAVANQDQIGEAIFRYMDAHSAQSGDGINTDELAAAIVRGIKASGLGVVNIGDRQIANAINRETVRSGKPAIQF